MTRIYFSVQSFKNETTEAMFLTEHLNRELLLLCELAAANGFII